MNFGWSTVELLQVGFELSAFALLEEVSWTLKRGTEP